MSEEKPYNKENMKCLFTQDDWLVWEGIQNRHSYDRPPAEESSPKETPLPELDFKSRQIKKLVTLLQDGDFDVFLKAVRKEILRCEDPDTLRDVTSKCLLCKEEKFHGTEHLHDHYYRNHGMTLKEVYQLMQLFVPRYYVNEEERP